MFDNLIAGMYLYCCIGNGYWRVNWMGNMLKKQPYEKPICIKEKGMNFPQEVIQTRNGKLVICRQCTNCHSCR